MVILSDINIVSAPQIRSSVTLLLKIARYENIMGWDGLQRHKICVNFSEKQANVGRVEQAPAQSLSRTARMVTSFLLCFFEEVG
jgi:hypothetical protein